jgi:hypothetical protein
MIYLRSFFFCLLISIPSLCVSADPVQRLTNKLSTGIDNKETFRVAVLKFPYLKERLSTGSYLISERILTELVRDGYFVVERRLFEKILEEQKLSQTGIMNPDTVKKIGDVLAVDGVVVGTLNDISNEETKLMARLIKVQTGEIMGSASTVIEREWRDLPRSRRMVRSRSIIPKSNPTMGCRQESSRKSRRFSLDKVSDSKQTYHPAPVPFFNPTMGFK